MNSIGTKHNPDTTMNKENNTVAYTPETAAEVYARIESLRPLTATPQAFYERLADIFRHVLDENSYTERVTLVGTFAKTDYLLRERHAGATLSAMVNDMRVRLLRIGRGETDADSVADYARDDVQALALFVQTLYSAPVPPSVASLFPQQRQRRRGKKAETDCVRMIVKRWDDDCIYGDTEDGRAVRVKVANAEGGGEGRDRSYLRPLLSRGAQLHLLRPHTEDGALVPEYIILSPDYLVDISQIAACMEDYADSPLVYMLKQLQPPVQTEATALGNLAGQMLDDELARWRNVKDGGSDGNDEKDDYRHTVTDFFRRNALSLLATPLSPHFHADALAQQRHIRQAIREDLPRHVGSFSADKAMVEPSFISPALGLQGRMDFLQLDYSLVMEQKSGKGEFVPGDGEPGVPKPKRTHYVQLLMYMAVLRYNLRGRHTDGERGPQAFLLYSKYPNPLSGVGFAPQLLFSALKLRNQLVWHQTRLAEGGFSILETITPQRLNSRGRDGALWRNYQLPQIESLLAPVHEASPLERAYCWRMLAFVQKEHVLSKLGNQTKENSGFASVWLSSLQEKVLGGNIFHALRLLSPAKDATGRVEEVTLAFREEGAGETANFRVGDIVMLYPYDEGQTPDATRGMVFRCSILDMDAHSVRLSLRKAQVDAWVLQANADKMWAVEHDFYESSSTALIRGVFSFLSAPKRRRELVLLQRHPDTDDTLTAAGEYGAFQELADRVRQSRELFLIIGPPGTGKTSFGMFNTLREELLHEGTNVAVMSYTNRAVDEICGKLAGTVDFIRIGNVLACPEAYLPHMFDNRVKTCAGMAEVEAMVARTRVFVGTTTAFNSAQPLFSKKKFSLAIIDEASQILEPHLLGILSVMHGGEPAIERFVLIGDHKQLPAVVQQRADESAVTDKTLLDAGLADCRLSFFERMLSHYSADPSVTFMLTSQGRMHADIEDFPNRMFYGGRLHPVPLRHQTAPLPDVPDEADDLTRLILTHRTLFLPSEPPTDSPSDKVNTVEADMIAEAVMRIYYIEKENFDVADTIGVIVPYRNQISAIRNAIDCHGVSELHGITIDTVERYQGSQRKYIIYGFTVQRHYQLRFLSSNTFVEDGKLVDRKLNVAMTRAKEHLIMVGNAELLSSNPLFRELVERTSVSLPR